MTFTSEDDYEIATCIRTSILPASVRWYTGDAVNNDVIRTSNENENSDDVIIPITDGSSRSLFVNNDAISLHESFEIAVAAAAVKMSMSMSKNLVGESDDLVEESDGPCRLIVKNPSNVGNGNCECKQS